MRVIAAIIDTVDLGTAGEWFARPKSYDKVAEAVIAVLEALRPAPAPQGKRKMAGIQTPKKYSEMPPEMPPHQIDRKAPSPEIYERHSTLSQLRSWNPKMLFHSHRERRKSL